jgi:formamidopyrimidine-DNA glycosylase
MMEIAEARVVADQLKNRCAKQQIEEVVVLASPHKFCWLNREPALFEQGLTKRTIEDATSSAHFVRLLLDDGTELICAEDVEIRLFDDRLSAGNKHQLLLGLSDGSVLRYSIKMYGFLFHGSIDCLMQNQYVRAAIEAVDPRTEPFDFERFVFQTELRASKGSVKQALATNQRIPGLGNGTLQDVLFEAGVSPKRKTSTLSEDDLRRLYRAVKEVLSQMTTQGGRDGNVDLFGTIGGYERRMKTERNECPRCASTLVKEAYLGGKVIYCPNCQK